MLLPKEIIGVTEKILMLNLSQKLSVRRKGVAVVTGKKRGQEEVVVDLEEEVVIPEDLGLVQEKE